MSGRDIQDGERPGLFAVSDVKSAMLARNWWVIALRGVSGILFGIIGLLMPDVTITVLILWFAAYSVIDGICALIAGIRAVARHQRWGALIFEGIVNLIAGAIALVWPAVTLLVFVWLIGGWAVLSGAAMLTAAFRLHLTHGKWFLALGGIASMVWGVLLFIAPVSGAFVLTWWLGAYALVFGAVLLVLAFRLRSQHVN